MKVVRRGVGTGTVVAVVIIVIVGAAMETYLLFQIRASGGTTSSSSTPSSSTSSVSSPSYQTTCTSSTPATAASLASFLNFTGLFNDYSSMTARLNGTLIGSIYNVTSTYTVLSASPHGFRVNVTGTGEGAIAGATLFAWRNGSVAWVFMNGLNETGDLAILGYLQTMPAFVFQALFTSLNFTSLLLTPGLVRAVGTSVVMIGKTSVNATTYEAAALPLVAGSCGTSVDFTRFSLQLGTVTGEPTAILTRLDLSGTFTNPSTGTVPADITLAVKSLTET